MDKHLVEVFDDTESLIGQKIQIRSELTQEVLNEKPGFLEKWAMSFFLTIILISIFIFSVIRYPDVKMIKGNISEFNDQKAKRELKFSLKLNLPQTLFSKIKVGQDVKVSFVAYPQSEYGSLFAKIDEISDTIDQNGDFFVITHLPPTVTTDQSKQLKLKKGFMCEAQIYIQNKTVLQRVISLYFNKVM